MVTWPFAIAGSLVVPAVLSLATWAAWAHRTIEARVYVLAIASGGSLGVIAALVLYLVVPAVAVSLGGLLVLPVIVGTAEEAAKALSVGWILRREEYRREAHGLLFGALAGLGFAGLENVGYVLSAGAQQGAEDMARVVVFRMATSLAHAAWTASLTSLVWREWRGSPQFTTPVITMFVGVATLHALWDYPLLPESSPEVGVALLLLSALCTVALLLIRIRAAVVSLGKARR